MKKIIDKLIELNYEFEKQNLKLLSIEVEPEFFNDLSYQNKKYSTKYSSGFNFFKVAGIEIKVRK